MTKSRQGKVVFQLGIFLNELYHLFVLIPMRFDDFCNARFNVYFFPTRKSEDDSAVLANPEASAGSRLLCSESRRSKVQSRTDSKSKKPLMYGQQKHFFYIHFFNNWRGSQTTHFYWHLETCSAMSTFFSMKNQTKIVLVTLPDFPSAGLPVIGQLLSVTMKPNQCHRNWSVILRLKMNLW